MAGLQCPKTGCTYNTSGQVDNAAALENKIAILRIHADVEHGREQAVVNNGVPNSVKAKMDTPKLQLGVDQQAWEQFMTRWKIFKATMGVDKGTASIWLVSYLDKDMGDELTYYLIGW